MSLRKRFEKALKYIPLFREAAEAVEDAVKDSRGVEVGEAELERWREEEADFKRKVVDPKTHADINENPYDLPKPAGECMPYIMDHDG